MATRKTKTNLAGAAAGSQPAAYRSGTRAGQGAATGATRRSTVDLPTEVSKQLVVRARQDDLTNQAVLSALATAYANGDERALAIVAKLSAETGR